MPELLPEDASSSPPKSTKRGEYVVVARRYRPQTFDELIGQKTVSQGLASAINTHRVGHAYLFTGARGVGKTSTARIFAKALNCDLGPTTSPCGKCDSCRSIETGEDLDVLEMDGASNRGIDEIRQLRERVGVRASRPRDQMRFKIYIIDEVHMLTTPAFNALLKTLEEPPEHVKFIFCTTEAEKIPITVLSRCQRFDFAPMELSSISGQLGHICRNEGIEAEPEALAIIARRAAGSMRDSQSLLEQLLSFGREKITASDVHTMLGTAQGGRLMAMVEQLLARDAAAGLGQLDTAVNEGVDAGQFAEQLLGMYRDMAAATVGCPAEMLLHSAASDFAKLAAAGQSLGLETILAVIQILDQAVVRMKQSTHVRTLVEIALIRICRLEDLDQLASLVAQLRQVPAGTVAPPRPAVPARASTPVAPIAPSTEVATNAAAPTQAETEAQKKNPPERQIRVDSVPANEAVSEPLSAIEAQQAWQQALTVLTDSGDMAADLVKLASDVAISGPNTLAVLFPTQYTYQKSACERPDRKTRLEEAVSLAAGRPVRLEFRLGGETPVKTADRSPPQPATLGQKAQRKREKERHPLVRQAMELFEAEVEHVSEPVRSEEAEVLVATRDNDT